MSKRMWLVFLGLLPAVCGCGTQQVLLGTEGEYLFTAFDALALPGEEVTLRARLQAGDLLGARGGYVVRFLRGGRLYKAAETDGSGVALVGFTPSAPGDYRFTAELSPSGFSQDPRELLVACRGPQQPLLVVDMDKTVVASGFDQVLIGEPNPMPKSPEVMKRLAGRYTVVYLTHRPDYFGPKSKAWLRQHDYPPGAVLLSGIGEFIAGSGAFKGDRLRELRKRFQRIEVGIGDKISDAQAYHDNGLKAFLILQIEPGASAEALRGLAESVGKLPEAVQVVTGWEQIEKCMYAGASFPRSRMVAELRKLADVRELEKSMPLR